MSEEYGKNKGNYNFWEEQAKKGQNNGSIHSEPEIQEASIAVQPQQETEQQTESQQSIELQQSTGSQPSGQQDQNFQFVETGWQPEVNANVSAGQNDYASNNTQYTTEILPVGNNNQNQNNQNQANHYTDTIEVMDMQQDSFEETKKDKKKKKEHGKTRNKIIGLVASAAIFGVVAGGAFSGVQYIGHRLFPDTAKNGTSIQQKGSGNKIATTTVSNTSAVTGPTAVTDVVQKTMPSIVSITSKITKDYGYWGKQDSEGSGSGIIINKGDKELLIVTNNHVIADANNISVKFIDDAVVKASVKGTDATADLAVLSVSLKDVKEDTLNKISVIEMGNSEDIKVGQMAIAIGNALGYGQSVTVGYISAKDRTVEVENSETMKLLQTDAAINPGNSGGALLDKDGKLIGINSAKYSDTQVEGMGYAIPITTATPIINDLMKREVLSDSEKGYLGVSVTEVSKEAAKSYNMPEGVYVSQLSDDGAAKEAGILVGDIITKIDDIEIKTGEALQEKVNSMRAGTKLTVILQRYVDGTYQEKQIEVTLKDKKTLDSLENSNTKDNSGSSSEQSPNQDSQGNDNNNQRDNGQQIDPNEQESIGDLFDYYFGQ